jgi:hypothetical protein
VISRRGWVIGAAAIVVIAAAAVFLFSAPSAAGPSAFSASPQGWLAARMYLERRGTRVDLLDRPIENRGAPEPLVLAFPATRPLLPAELEDLGRRVSAGGTLVFAYSGRSPEVAEQLAADAVGLRFEVVRKQPPLSPRRWWAWASADWRLRPEIDAGPTARELVVRAPRVVAQGPAHARVLYRGEGSVPAAFSMARGRGRVLALPADAFSNARVTNPGNADLLEGLRALGPAIAFDEYAHGFSAPGAAPDAGSAPSLDLLLFQLAALYAACVWVLARRFGPSWREPPVLAGSTAPFLLGLGALHRDLGHSAEASWRLIQNVEALDPRVSVGKDARQAAVDASDATFVDIARAVARQQHGRRS